jgi:hypothetical protein
MPVGRVAYCFPSLSTENNKINNLCVLCVSNAPLNRQGEWAVSYRINTAGSGHIFTAHSLPSFETQSAQRRNFYGESGDADSP